MISLGIDLSLTASGYVYLKDGKILHQDLIKTKPTGNDIVKELERLFHIRDEIKILEMDIIVLEGLAYMARNTRALVQLAGLNYLVREMFYNMGKRFIIIPPTVLKKFVTGKGNCGKDIMLLEIYKRYSISFEDNNLADAYGLAKLGEALLDEEIKLTKFQEEIINKLKLQLCQKQEV